MTPGARMLGTVLDVLETSAQHGHVYMPLAEVCQLVAQRLGVSPGAADIGVRDAAVAKHVVMRGTRVYLPRHDAAEQCVAALVRAATR